MSAALILLVSVATTVTASAAHPRARVADAAGPPVRVVYVVPRGQGASLVMSNLDGSRYRLLTSRPGAGTRRFDQAPTWSPDGRRVAFLRATSGNGFLYAIDASGGAPRQLASVHPLAVPGAPPNPSATGLGRPIWSPDGRKLAFGVQVRCEGGQRLSDVGLFTVQADGRRLRRLPALRASDYRRRRDALFVHPFEWSHSARQILYTVGRYADSDCRYQGLAGYTLARIEIGARARRELFRVPILGAVRSAPDGSRLAWWRPTELDPNVCDLIVGDRDGRSSRAVIRTAASVCVWPDSPTFHWLSSRQIVYTSGNGVAVIDVGTGKNRQIVGWFDARIVGLSRDLRLIAVERSGIPTSLAVFRLRDGRKWPVTPPPVVPTFIEAAVTFAVPRLKSSVPRRRAAELSEELASQADGESRGSQTTPRVARLIACLEESVLKQHVCASHATSRSPSKVSIWASGPSTWKRPIVSGIRNAR